jgi:hypothetical protein
LPARTSATNCWDKSREDVYELSYRVPMANSNAPKGAQRAHKGALVVAVRRNDSYLGIASAMPTNGAGRGAGECPGQCSG